MTDTTKIRNLIIHDLEEIKDLVEYFENYPVEIPEIEIDLALDKLREVYSRLILLKRPEGDNRKKLSLPSYQRPVEPVSPSLSLPVQSDEPEKPVRKSSSARSKTIADKFSGPVKNINENMARKKSSIDLSTKFINKPIDDLHKALGVNDKFLLTKELFNGDRNKFNAVIDHLNSLKSFSEAEQYISQNFQWDMDNDVVIGLMAFLRRRYSE